MIVDCVVYGSIMGALPLACFSIVLWGTEDGELGRDCNKHDGVACESVERARAVAFLVLNTLLLLHAYTCRHESASAFSMSWTENKVLLGALVGGVLVCIPIIYIPWINTFVFKHGAIGWEWALLVASSILFMAVSELYKVIRARFVRVPSARAQ